MKMKIFLKKLLVLFYYVALILLFIWLVSSDAVKVIFSGLEGGGILVKMAAYFKDADTWNLIFIMLFFSFAVGLLLIYNNLVDKLLKFIGRKIPRVDFINQKWADYAIQLPVWQDREYWDI